MAIPPLPPLRVREADGSPNIIPVFELVISGATVSRIGGTSVQLLMDSGAGATGAPVGSQYVTMALDPTLTAERTLAVGTGLTLTDAGANSAATIALSVPVAVTSGGTGVSTLEAFGVLYGSGASAVQALAAMVSGSLVVGSGTTVRPHVLPGGAQGQYLISTGGVVGNVAWVNTLGGSAAVTYAATGNQYLTLANAADLTAERVWTASTGLTSVDGGADSTFLVSVNPNVRDKTAGFFAGGNLATTHLAANSRVYIPFNMELRDVRLAVVTTHVGANIIVNVGQFGTPVSAMSAFFTNALRPIIATGTSFGSAGTISNNVMFAGSWLGFSIDQVGSTTAGSDMTVTVIARSS